MYPDNYLVHHGIDGQKWGRRNGPPYPLLRNAAGQLRARAQAKRKARTEAKATKIAEAKARQRESTKKYLRDNPEKLYKRRNELTKDEIDEIIKQIEWDRRVKDISAAEHQRNMEKLTKGLHTVADVTSDAYRIYNNFNNVRKAVKARKEEKVKEKEDKEKKKSS